MNFKKFSRIWCFQSATRVSKGKKRWNLKVSNQGHSRNHKQMSGYSRSLFWPAERSFIGDYVPTYAYLDLIERLSTTFKSASRLSFLCCWKWLHLVHLMYSKCTGNSEWCWFTDGSVYSEPQFLCMLNLFRIQLFFHVHRSLSPCKKTVLYLLKHISLMYSKTIKNQFFTHLGPVYMEWGTPV